MSRWTALAVLFFLSGAAIRPASGQTPYPPPQPYAPTPPYPPPAWYPPVPERQPQLVHRTRWGFLIAGTAIFVGLQALALLVTANETCTGETGSDLTNCEAHRDYFWIPVVGPWLRTSASTHHGTGDWAFAAIWGLTEIFGLVMIGVGFAGHDVLAPAPRPRPMWGVVPLKTNRSTGLALRLEF